MSIDSPLDGLHLIQRSVRLADYTTYKLGGPARWYAEVGTREDLQAVATAIASSPVAVLILGRGSNLVVSDTGFDGLALRLGGDFSRIEFHDDSIVAGAGVHLPLLARSAANAGRLGLEFFVGIPGSVGGAVRQNAGCHGSETVEWLQTAEVLDLTTALFSNRDSDELDLGYRHSNLAAHELVTGAVFAFEFGEPSTGQTRIREVTRWRRENQPGGTINAGSVFKNPPGDHAGRIIESLGLKGFSIGGVSVSERHANFFVASSDATSSDLYELVRSVRKRVREETGVELEPELVFAGTFEERS